LYFDLTGKNATAGDNLMADLTADHIVRHLDLAGSMIMRSRWLEEEATIQAGAALSARGLARQSGD
jgi:hypothetical protein